MPDPSFDNPLWFKDAIFYEVYCRAYADSNGDGHGDLRGLTQKLDYIKSLGVDCIWLLPIYPSPLLDDGYDIANYYGVHPDYGSLEDFKTLVKEAHARGLRVIADLVMNHTSDQHPWFQSARASKDSPYRDYYVWSDTDQKYAGTRIIFVDTEKSNWTWDPVAGQYFWHRFYSSQPDLNFDNPAVRHEMINVMDFWLGMGIDGFRADAVPYLFEREGTSCENLPETHAYLKEIRHFMNVKYPGRILLGEANQWPVDLRPYMGDGDEFHMAFHFPLMPRIFMALRQADVSPILGILALTPEIPDNCQWCTFLRNHDELTLEMVTEQERQWMWREYAPEPRMRLNLGIRRRLAPLLDGDLRKIELANALLFALPGSPILYYGDEIGMGDDIWMDDRDGVRTPMQWTGDEKVGFSSAPLDSFYSRPIADLQFGYHAVNVAAQLADPDSLWHRLQRLITIRKSLPVLSHGHSTLLGLDNPAILAVVRSLDDDKVVALHNLSPQPQTFDVRQAGVGRARRLIGQGTGDEVDLSHAVTLPGYGYAWLRAG